MSDKPSPAVQRLVAKNHEIQAELKKLKHDYECLKLESVVFKECSIKLEKENVKLKKRAEQVEAELERTRITFNKRTKKHKEIREVQRNINHTLWKERNETEKERDTALEREKEALASVAVLVKKIKKADELLGEYSMSDYTETGRGAKRL